jgi:hypothetical protein
MADSAPAHRINQVEVDVRVPGVVQAEALLAGSNGWCASQLAPTIERVCSELSGPEYIDRIERLELDLGSIAQEDFDIEFAERLELALRAELTRQLGQRSARARAQRASLELVETFARTGNLPWWADARDSEIVAAQLRELVSREPREFGGLLQRLGGDPVAIAARPGLSSSRLWARHSRSPTSWTSRRNCCVRRGVPARKGLSSRCAGRCWGCGLATPRHPRGPSRRRCGPS